MKRLILGLLFTIYSVSAWCQYPHNYTQNLQQIAQVTFPDTPKVVTKKSGVIYTVNYNGIIYTASVGIGNVIGDLVDTRSLDSLYGDGIRAITQDTAAKLIYKRDIIAEGVKGIEFGCISNDININSYLFCREFYFNQRMVIQMVWFPKAVQRNDNRVNTFFNTFKIKIKPSEIRQTNSSMILSMIKYAFIAIVLLAIIIVLIVFLARRNNSKTTR